MKIINKLWNKHFCLVIVNFKIEKCYTNNIQYIYVYIHALYTIDENYTK